MESSIHVFYQQKLHVLNAYLDPSNPSQMNELCCAHVHKCDHMYRLNTCIHVCAGGQVSKYSAYWKFVSKVPAKLLGEEIVNSSFSHDLGKLSRVPKRIRKPELSTTREVSMNNIFSTCCYVQRILNFRGFLYINHDTCEIISEPTQVATPMEVAEQFTRAYMYLDYSSRDTYMYTCAIRTSLQYVPNSS